MIRFVFLFLALLLLISPTIGFTQTKELKEIKKDIEELKKGQEGIQKEIQEIKKLLQTRQAPMPPPAPTPAEFKEIIINVKNDPFKGSKEAKLAIIEIFDYQ